MYNITLLDEIKTWINGLPYWAMWIAEKLINKKIITEEASDKAYHYFLEDAGLNDKKLEREEIKININGAIDGKTIENLQLLEISGNKNVNALENNQKITFGKNITVIYGSNGSGKTGYIRLMNNLFNSRGDKELLTNIYLEKLDDPACIIKFKYDDSEYDLKYPGDEKFRDEFKFYAVYDNQSVRFHLDMKNELYLTPEGLEFFSLLSSEYNKISEKFNGDINKVNIENNLKINFNSEEIINVINNINEKTEIEKIKILSNVSEDDKIELKQLEKRKNEILVLDVEKRIKDLNNISNLLEQQDTKFNELFSIFSELNISSIKNDIDFISKNEANQYDISTEKIKKIITNDSEFKLWKNFIEAAYKFAEMHHKSDRFTYPDEHDKCIFCQQPLSKEASDLIKIYWSIINNEIESKINDVKVSLSKIKEKLGSIDLNCFSDGLILTNWLTENYSDELKILKQYIEFLLIQKANLINNMLNKNWNNEIKPFKYDATIIVEIKKKINLEINEIKCLKTTEELKILNEKINLINDKVSLSKIIDQVEKLINNLKWYEKAKNRLNDLNTRNITIKQNQIYSTYISNGYKEIFETECQKLNANLKVEINQTSSKGQTYRKLMIKNYEPKKILSEGEQRAISIADFLTEIQILGFNKGIIMDDPVNSLDHERKSIIAKRLVEEASKRQVIIFTHDLYFVHCLKNYSNDDKLEFKCHWNQRREKPGMIFLDNSPASENDYKSVEKAQKFYELSKKASPEEQESLLKQGFGALRTNYEALVIFELFNEVVLRFNERVSIDRLNKVVVTPDIIKKIIEKNGLISRYIEGHLHSDAYVATKPDPNVLFKEIQEFQNLKKEIKELKK